jgi:hypothetical protein
LQIRRIIFTITWNFSFSVESTMGANRDFKDFFSIMNAERVEYLVVGEFAFYFYVEPHFTKNLDIWVHTSKENAERAWTSLTKFGIPLMESQRSDFTKPELGYQIGVKDVRIKMLGGIAGVAFIDAYQRAAPSAYAGVPIKIIGRQDLIASRKATGRQQDLLDAQRLEAATQ